MDTKRIPQINLICPNCQTVFGKRGKTKFCCVRCANTFNARERRHRLSTTVYLETCKKCGKEIQKPRRSFCSSLCKNLFNHAKCKYKYGKNWQCANPANFISTLINKKRRVLGGLTKANVYEVYLKQNGLCALTKVPMTYKRFKGKVATNISIDRIDSTKGYSIDNIQLVCFIVNMMKYDLSLSELKQWCYRIIKGTLK